MSTANYWYTIPEWYGIQQHKDGTLLPAGTAFDARNMETGDGNLSVAKGYERYIPEPVPSLEDEGPVLKLILARGSGKTYVVTTRRIWRWSPGHGQWVSMHRFNPALTGKQVDTLETRIGSQNVILVATGATQIIKIDTEANTASLFGAGETSYTGTVAAYDEENKTITLAAEMDSEAQRRCLAYGVMVGDYAGTVKACTATTITLKYSLTEDPSIGVEVTVRGGGSNAHVSLLALFANRLFAAGDPEAPYRLYWSAVPGDGRTTEDWLSVDGSYDASGGYVEVGDGCADGIIGLVAISSQLLIFKRYSIWRLYGDRPSNFTLERIDKESDIMSQSGVVTKYDTPYLLMPKGMMTYNGVSVVPVDEGAQYLRRFFEESAPDVSHSRGAVWNNRFYVSCRVGENENEYDDTVIVLDVARNAYMLRDGFLVADMVGIGSDIYMVDGNRCVCRFEQGDTYDGAPIEAWWQTQPLDFGYKMGKHQAQALYAHLEGSDMAVSVFTGRLKDRHQITPRRLADGYSTVPLRIDQAHALSFLFENEAGGRFCLCGGINLKILTERKE